MEPVSMNVVTQGNYIPKQSIADPAHNIDTGAVPSIKSIPAKPMASTKEFSQEVRQAAEKAMLDIEHFISSQQRSLRVSKDAETGHMVVQIVDPSSGEVIRTLPSEELLRLARTFETLGNVMVNQRA
jgi:flagellar protein FlaG